MDKVISEYKLDNGFIGNIIISNYEFYNIEIYKDKKLVYWSTRYDRNIDTNLFYLYSSTYIYGAVGRQLTLSELLSLVEDILKFKLPGKMKEDFEGLYLMYKLNEFEKIN